MSLMKRILSLACIALVCASSLTACIKKANPAPEFPFGDSITLFIMDTTQALLPEAKLQILILNNSHKESSYLSL